MVAEPAANLVRVTDNSALGLPDAQPRHGSPSTQMARWDMIKEVASVLGASIGTGMIPGWIKNKYQIVPILLKADELGIGWMYALQHISLIDGKPNVEAQALANIIMASVGPDAITQVESTDQRARVRMKRPGREPQEYSYSIEEARKAGLTNKKNWQSYPADMLWWRAVARGARRYFPDVISGMYIREELEIDQSATGSAYTVVASESIGDTAPPIIEGVSRPALTASTVIDELPWGPDETITPEPMPEPIQEHQSATTHVSQPTESDPESGTSANAQQWKAIRALRTELAMDAEQPGDDELTEERAARYIRVLQQQANERRKSTRQVTHPGTQGAKPKNPIPAATQAQIRQICRELGERIPALGSMDMTEGQCFLAELQAKLEKRAGGTPNPAPAIPLVQAPAGDEAGSEWDEVEDPPTVDNLVQEATRMAVDFGGSADDYLAWAKDDTGYAQLELSELSDPQRSILLDKLSEMRRAQTGG